VYVSLNCLKNLCLSLVSGVPHFFLRLHPWSRSGLAVRTGRTITGAHRAVRKTDGVRRRCGPRWLAVDTRVTDCSTRLIELTMLESFVLSLDDPFSGFAFAVFWSRSDRSVSRPGPAIPSRTFSTQ